MMRAAFKSFFIGLSLLAAGLLNAQTRFRLADPQALSGAGNGWAVEPGTGDLSFAIPVATVPGEIPIPAVYRVAASYSVQRRKVWVVDTEFYRPIRLLETDTNIHRPMLGTLHFGFIDNGGNFNGINESATYVLENGIQFRQEDWVAFTTFNTIFTLPQDFGLAAIAAGSAMVSTDRGYAYYVTDAAGLGATVNAKVQATLPVGHPAPTQFKVILDKDRARVMAFLSGLNAWAPLLWLDRFGHQVAFKWTMSKAGLPVGATALHGVVVSNQRAGQPPRGLQVQWATWASGTEQKDLLRADFIGMDAPSILVRGYSGQAALLPVGLTITPARDGDAIARMAIAGVVGRPTQIQVGHSNTVPEPVWVGTASALPKVQPMIVQPPPSAALRQWTVGYDANQAAITDFTDALGVSTLFDYGTGTFPYAYPQDTYSAYGNLGKYGVTAATSTDSQQDPASLTVPQFKRTWARSAVVSNSWTTTYQEWWPSIGPAERKVELGFGSATEAIHYANNQLALQRTLSVDGATQYSKTLYAMVPGGLANVDSVITGSEVSRKDEATFRDGYGYTNGLLTARSRVTGPTSSPGIPLEQTDLIYDTKKDKLDIGRPTSVTVTRTDGSLTTLSPTRITRTEYDATTRLPRKAYLDGGTVGQLGQTTAYDGEGRPVTQANFASFSTDAVATTTVGYGSDGYPGTATTAYTRPANQAGIPSVGQGATYDSAGRILTQTDALGVQTTFSYDTLGRPTSRSRQGEPAISYGYPDERTRTLTRAGRITTEQTDGFGRLVRRILPDGRRVDFVYDAHGRRVAQKEFNQGGTASRASSTSYDLLDRPTGFSSPGGASQTITYAASLDLKQSIVTTSVAGLNVSRKETRDVLGQVVKVEEPTGAVSVMAFDGAGNLKTVTTTDAATHTQTRAFSFNALGLLTEKTEPETGKQTFKAPNALGLPGTVTEAAGTPDERIRTILYDGLGRVCKVSSSTGTDTVETFFDGALLTGASGGGPAPVTMGFAYKPPAEGRRLASESTTLGGVAHGLSYAYLGTGQLDTVTYPAGRIVGYAYDTNGRITGLQDRTGGGSKAIVSTVAFDDWGQRKRLTFGSGAYSDWSTQKMGTQLDAWTIGYTTGGLGDPANPRTHTYDTAERLTQAGEWQGLTHDSANRLGSASAPSLGVEGLTFNHDGFGNNTSQQMSGPAASSFNNFTFNPLSTNRLPATTTTGGLTGWLMDGRGEASQVGTGTSSGQYLGLGWDALGRVKSLATAGLAQGYTYAPSGLRIRVLDTATPANNRRYAYTSGGLLMSEYTDAGWKRDVVYLGSEPVAEVDAAGIHELHSDHLGTPRIVTNGTTAQIEGKQAYGPYGESLTAQAIGYRPLTGYTGHLQNDPTGLIYMRGRFYSPAWHRFLNSDQGVDPNSWNQMAYVGGSPFMAVDPSGMKISHCWVIVWTHCIGSSSSGWQCSSEIVGEFGDCSAYGDDPAPQTQQKDKDCGQKVLQTYQGRVIQAAKTWQSATSWPSLGKAFMSYDSQPSWLKVVGWGSGASDQVTSRLGVRGIPAGVNTALFGFSTMWSFIDGLAGVDLATGQANTQLQNQIDQAASDYWKGMKDCAQ
ncbi:MAG: RHS repeat-associated core domain-containing protein [Geothrix sp.]|nr:RHS repeat-associated core domain-containing protein [Geothrix sp.]